MPEFYVYILASRYRGTMYVGVTNNLSRRVGEHKSGAVPDSPNVTKSIGLCIANPTHQLWMRGHERALKRWHRDWKFKLIEAQNPKWLDLSPDIAQ